MLTVNSQSNFEKNDFKYRKNILKWDELHSDLPSAGLTEAASELSMDVPSVREDDFCLGQKTSNSLIPPQDCVCKLCMWRPEFHIIVSHITLSFYTIIDMYLHIFTGSNVDLFKRYVVIVMINHLCICM